MAPARQAAASATPTPGQFAAKAAVLWSKPAVKAAALVGVGAFGLYQLFGSHEEQQRQASAEAHRRVHGGFGVHITRSGGGI
ncbi:hypothetical protein GQ42DRAFT_161184 [Ramicandelaber brevisporus]|nr:hypothetical protein GQ42DRAFT_161184 [Ramicandelaber brevisporus]